MNDCLKIFDFVVSRMAAGQRAEFEHRQVEDAFPHPPPPSRLWIELEICLLLSRPRGTAKPRPEPLTQQEKIDKWAKRHNLRVNRDPMTMNLHVEKLQPRGECCGVPLVPSMGKRLKGFPVPRHDRVPSSADLCETEVVRGMKCPECGKFEPLKD